MQRRYFLMILVLVAACGKPLPVLEGFNGAAWKGDPSGCKGDRTKQREVILASTDKMKGLSESDIITLLGKPDRNDLYERNQKFYYYFLRSGPACPDRVVERLTIRFNAMGYAQVVTVMSE